MAYLNMLKNIFVPYIFQNIFLLYFREVKSRIFFYLVMECYCKEYYAKYRQLKFTCII